MLKSSSYHLKMARLVFIEKCRGHYLAFLNRVAAMKPSGFPASDIILALPQGIASIMAVPARGRWTKEQRDVVNAEIIRVTRRA